MPVHLTAFVEFLNRAERTSGSIHKHCHDVAQFACWLDGKEVCREEAVEWKYHLLRQRYTPITVNSMILAMNLFLILWDGMTVGWKPLKFRGVFPTGKPQPVDSGTARRCINGRLLPTTERDATNVTVKSPVANKTPQSGSWRSGLWRLLFGNFTCIQRKGWCHFLCPDAVLLCQFRRGVQHPKQIAVRMGQSQILCKGHLWCK